MRKSQIILLTAFIVITGAIYIVLSGNKKEFNKELKSENKVVYVPIQKVQNEIREMSLTSYGQISPNAEIVVSMEVQGKLEKGDVKMKPGIRFSKGQILYRVNNEEAFYTLSSQKSNLSNALVNALPDIELDFPDEKNKWISFLNNLHPGKLLPDLPNISSGKERLFLISRNILSQYYSLKSQEARMEKYFFVAPFNGTVTEVYAEPGSIVNPGGQIAKIAKTGDYEVRVPISFDDLTMYKEKSQAEFSNSKGDVIASGKIIRISDVINQQTQSADVYYSIAPKNGEQIYHGMFVNVSINKKAMKETMTLPRVAVNDGKVKVLNNNKLKEQQVVVVGSKPDSIFVTGLKDGVDVLLEQIEAEDHMIFKGIYRD